jgi:flagellin
LLSVSALGNTSRIAANNALAQQQNAIERLSSGKRINSAKDDAAGLAISERMTSQIRAMDVGRRNLNDGVSVLQTADAAMSEISNNLQRIRELAVQAANSVVSDSDRSAIGAEAQELLNEIDRSSSVSTFGGQALIDGTFTAKTIATGNGQSSISLNLSSMTSSGLGVYDKATASVVSNGTVTGSNPNGYVSATTNANGESTIIWSSVPPGGGTGKLILQRYGEYGVATGSPVELENGYGVAQVPELTFLENGSIALTYFKWNNPRYDTKLQIVDESGNVTSNLTVNSGEAVGDYTNPEIIDVGNSEFLVKWHYNTDHPSDGVDYSSVSRYSYDGSKVGGSVVVSQSPLYSGSPISRSLHTVTDDLSQLTNGDITLLELDRSTGTKDSLSVRVFDPETLALKYDQTVADLGINNLGNHFIHKLEGSYAVSWLDTSNNTAYIREFDLQGSELTTTTALKENVNRYSAQVRTGLSGATYIDIVYGSSLDGNSYYNSFDDQFLQQQESDLQVFTSVDNELEIISLSGSQLRIFDTEDYSRIISYTDVDVTESGLEFGTVDDAQRTIVAIDAAIQRATDARAEAGAQLNRLDSAARSLEASNIQARASRSRILDADFAQETAALTKAQILSQSSTAMIAQANAQAGMVLRLLQGL